MTDEVSRFSTVNPDLLELLSLGIDIGSSTSHMIVSRLVLQRRGVELSSRFEVAAREIVYASPILLTPYTDPEVIDADALARFIDRSYAQVGLKPSKIDTGAVICTGEAVRKRNAEAITRLFSSRAGRFVCATAGPNLEATLAAHGSGAVTRSRGQTVMNVDVGGGTSKAAIVRDGAVLETAAINVGSRLISWDKEGRLDRIEAAGAKVARSAGLEITLGQRLSDGEKEAMAGALAALLFEFLCRGALSPLAKEFLVTPPLAYRGQVSEVLFSGGVSEYIYERERKEYGDLGPLFGGAVRRRMSELQVPVGEPREGLRATVIGCSQYTIQVSSSTIHLSREGLLPIRDLLVVAPILSEDDGSPESITRAITTAFQRVDLDDHERPVALCLKAPWQSSYATFKNIAAGIAEAVKGRNHGQPLVLVFSRDIGALVGSILKEELEFERDVVAVDEVDIGELDFIDIGDELGHTQAVPVVVKSLVFKR